MPPSPPALSEVTAHRERPGRVRSGKFATTRRRRLIARQVERELIRGVRGGTAARRIAPFPLRNGLRHIGL